MTAGSPAASTTDRLTAIRGRFGPAVFTVAAVLLLLYVCFVVLAGITVIGVRLGTVHVVAGFVAGLVLILVLRRAGTNREAAARLFDFGVAGLVLFASVIVVDVGYTMVLNGGAADAGAAVSADVRASDSHVWHGELFPRSFYPTSRNFFLYKPNARLSAETYGEYYQAEMRRSPLLRDSVLEPRRLTYAIGPDGLRELRPLSSCRTVALGDSYVLGYATDEPDVWTARLGVLLGEPVCNFGVSSTGPRSQFELLDYLLARPADSLPIERVLWMIFEGNDLENSYDERREMAEPRNRRRELLSGTLPELAFATPGRLRNQSVLRRLMKGELRLREDRQVPSGGRVEVDGVHLSTPLHRSSRFGYKLFNPDDVRRATLPASYVSEHPHRPLLDQTFAQMKALAGRRGFSVTVIVAPSDARLQGPAFEDFPTLSDRPHFIEYVVGLARRNGYPVINLLPLMQPAAREQLLYFRDDHHWNAQGNALAATLIHEALRSEGR